MTHTEKSVAILSRWFPSYTIGASAPLLIDSEYHDFDQQAERLAGHDQTYLQLTPGRFVGRFFSGFFGADVSIHIEYCNQALEQKVGGHPTALSLGIVLDESSVFRFNGRTLTGDDVMVLPPGGYLDVYSPVNGVVMAILVDRDRLLNEPGLAPQAADWLLGAGRDMDILRAPKFAARLREDATRALEGAGTGSQDPDRLGAVIGNALIASIAAQLSLEWASATGPDNAGIMQSYRRFLYCRAEIADRWRDIDDVSALTRAVSASKRSVEHAFSEHLAVGPLTYLRILRLHKVRNALADSDLQHDSIGDIAARHGFWNWSRFSQTYRNHFGELPSTTREHLSS